MSVREALQSDNLLCYRMNGEPLPSANGFPVRLIAPGWYGVANVKWLTRIEVMNQRFASNFMARDYVTIREQQREGNTVWTFNTVRHDRLKSAPAKVTRRQNRYTIMGAAWGAPIQAVQVQIDTGPWRTANLDGPKFRRTKASPGGSGRSTGEHRRQASTGSRRGRSTLMGTSSRRPRILSSLAEELSGKTMVILPAECVFPDDGYRNEKW